MASIGGQTFKNKEELATFIRTIKTEDPMPIKVKRDGQLISKQVAPKVMYVPHYAQVVVDILNRKEKINLVIVVNEVSKSLVPSLNEEWRLLLLLFILSKTSLDVDLASSTRTCLKYLWLLLEPGGVLFSQDGHLPLIINVFDDDSFWLNEIGCKKPAIIGLGKSKLIRITKEV